MNVPNETIDPPETMPRRRMTRSPVLRAAIASAAATAASLLCVSAAHAQDATTYRTTQDTTTYRTQETTYWERQLPAPTNAFELKVGTGYTQGFGMIAPGVGIPHVAGAGIGVNVDADYRVSPRWSWGIQGQYQELGNQLNAASRGLLGSLGVTVHGAPFTTADPWARVAVGYRMLWLVDPPGEPTTMLHGFEVASLALGYDLRMASAVAISPVIGADVNVFVWQTANGATTPLSSAQVGTFIFAGLQMRFDAGPTAVQAPNVVADLR